MASYKEILDTLYEDYGMLVANSVRPKVQAQCDWHTKASGVLRAIRLVELIESHSPEDPELGSMSNACGKGPCCLGDGHEGRCQL